MLTPSLGFYLFLVTSNIHGGISHSFTNFSDHNQCMDAGVLIFNKYNTDLVKISYDCIERK